MGAKRRLNGTSKVSTRKDRRTDRQTFRLIESICSEGRCFEKKLFLLHYQDLLIEDFFDVIKATALKDTQR